MALTWQRGPVESDARCPRVKYVHRRSGSRSDRSDKKHRRYQCDPCRPRFTPRRLFFLSLAVKESLSIIYFMPEAARIIVFARTLLAETEDTIITEEVKKFPSGK